MLKTRDLLISVFSVNSLVLLFIPVSLGQIVPDHTLPINSETNRQGSTTIIQGGTIQKNNLYHSFEEFSINSGSTAYFNNESNIKNILVRVTGGTSSNIDGILKSNSGSVFFLNPNGILFGVNAKLSIPGSFIATTAANISFPDGNLFGVENSTNNFLSDKEPNGLIFPFNAAPITLEGNGNLLYFANPANPVGSPILGGGIGTSGLTGSSGTTIGLLGGPISLIGANITAPSGKVEIGSIGSSGIVGLQENFGILNFDYSQISLFQDVQLSNRALIDSSGVSDSTIHIQSRNLTVNDSSLIFTSNFGNQQNSKIIINASDSIIFDSVSPQNALLAILYANKNNFIPFGGIYTQNFADGKGASIYFYAQNVNLKDFSLIDTFNYGSGNGGDIVGSIGNTLTISGKPPIPGFFFPSAISTVSFNGDTGSIYLAGKNFYLIDGGESLSDTLGSGKSGNANYNFTNDIYVMGGFYVNSQEPSVEPSFEPSSLGTLSTLSGNTGNTDVSSNNLFVLNGGTISTNSNGLGSAGELNINTKNLLEISGSPANSNNPLDVSQIVSSVVPSYSAYYNQLFSVPNILGSTSGGINIKASTLLVKGGLISVNNDGSGTGGNLKIIANNIELNKSTLNATATNSNSSGGSINLTANNLLSLRDGSLVVASAIGPGGDIISNSSIAIGDSSSGFFAKSTNSHGGNITFNTQDRVIAPDFSFTASSALGPSFNGNILINNASNDPAHYIKPISNNLTPPKTLKPCDPENPSNGIDYFGAGGFPQNSEDKLDISLNWQPQAIQTPIITTDLTTGEKIHWVEPSALVKNTDGTLSFVVNNSSSNSIESRNTCIQSNANNFPPKSY